MKKAEVKIGEVYIMKVSNKLAPVKVEGESGYGRGWYGTNLRTGREVRIRSGAKLRRVATEKERLLAHNSSIPQQ